MSYYNPRLIGGSLDSGLIPKTGLALFLGTLLALACAGVAVGYAFFGPSDVVERIKLATVWIIVDGDTQGSGVIVREDGYVLTAAHVVKGGKCGEVIAVFKSGQKDAEKIAATCTEHVGTPAGPHPSEIGKDYALLKLEADHPLPTLPVIGSDQVTEGTRVFVAGFPLGEELAQSYYGPNVRVEPGHVTTVMRGGEQGAIAFNTDARTVQGMSGGPCTTDRGEVVGIISMGSENAATYLTLPTSRFRHVWEPLKK
ncbi:MAG: trypsin-like peptidase domain-containing protein [Armatimonadetes bacterium]|nr:trypsin-like peptidase domain-containing protein [Armatimonadota bacterium]